LVDGHFVAGFGKVVGVDFFVVGSEYFESVVGVLGGVFLVVFGLEFCEGFNDFLFFVLDGFAQEKEGSRY
jgi:hypothetical protein